MPAGQWPSAATGSTVPTIAFSPDGRTLASGSYDGSIKLWEVASGTLLWTGWHADSIYNVAFAPDGSLLASGGNDATVRLWDRQSGTHLQTLSHPDPVYAITWSPDGRLLASGGLAGQIRVWGIRIGCFLWPGVPMDASWPVAAATKRSGCGMSNRAALGRRCRDIPQRCTAWPSRLTAAACLVAVTMAPCVCGMSPMGSAYALCRAMRFPSSTSTGVRMARTWSVAAP